MDYSLPIMQSYNTEHANLYYRLLLPFHLIPLVRTFDIEFEKERAEGKWDENAEPGDDPRAPYKTEHCLAEIIERLVARELGVDWKQHCEYQQYEPKVLNGMEEEVYNKG